LEKKLLKDNPGTDEGQSITRAAEVTQPQEQQQKAEPKIFLINITLSNKKLPPITANAIEQPNGTYLLDKTYSDFDEAEEVQTAINKKFKNEGYKATIESKSTDPTNPFADEIHSVRIDTKPVTPVQAEQPVDKAETPQEEEQEDQENIDEEELVFELDETIRTNPEIMNILTEYRDTDGNIDLVKMGNLMKADFSRFSFFTSSLTKSEYNKLTYILKDDSKKETFRNTIRQVVALRSKLKGTSYSQELTNLKVELEELLYKKNPDLLQERNLKSQSTPENQ
jgi:hypothetical protein